MHTAEEVRTKTNHLRGLFGQHELREMLLAYADLLEVLHELGTYGIHKETVYRTLDRAAEGAEQGMSDEQYAADCEGYGGSGRNKVPRGLVFVPFFDENKLGSEIARVWGANGAHAEVYGMMRKELSAAKAEAENFHMAYRMKCDEETKKQAVEIERLRAEAERLREALSFYAEDRRYLGPNQRREEGDKWTPEDYPYMVDVSRDRGEIAKAALAATRKEEGNG